MARDDSAAVRAFEMLTERLASLEEAVARSEKRVADAPLQLDVREIMLIPAQELVFSKIRPGSKLYRLCERLETILSDAVKDLEGSAVLKTAIDRLRELGANRITFLMLDQISWLCDDTEAVIDFAFTSYLVPIEESVAYALRAEDIVHCNVKPRDEALAERLFGRISAFLRRHKWQWKNIFYSPGEPWTIASY
nr:hypothetical protein TetV2_00307 [Oceanusvirus sp.]